MTYRIRSLSRQEVRELDTEAARDHLLPTLILMENAGRGAATWLAKLAAGMSTQAAPWPFSSPLPGQALEQRPHSPKFLILCGPGNNGGDGGGCGEAPGCLGVLDPNRLVLEAGVIERRCRDPVEDSREVTRKYVDLV
jgi:YjeF-related protein N-terminus